METLGSRFGNCACGGAFEEHVVAVTARGKGRRKGAQLLEVEEGACPICGSRVYKPRSLQAVESAFRALRVRPA